MSHSPIVVFFDGSIKKGENGGIGYVVKNMEGTILFKGSEKIEETDSMVAEARALQAGITYALENCRGVDAIYIKGDNKGVIDFIDPERNGHVSGDAYKILCETRQQLSQVDFIKGSTVTNRCVNEQADKLARQGRLS